MASAEDTLRIWQALADRGEESRIPANMQTAFAEARKRGLIRDNRNFVSKMVNPQREDFPEVASGGTPESALEAERTLGKDSTARLDTDKYGNPVLVGQRGTFYVNRPGPSLNDIPRFGSAVDRTAHQVAPYLAGGVVAAPARAAVGAAVQGAIGVADAATRQGANAMQGKEVDASQLWKTPLYAMSGELAGRTVAAVATPILTKLFGKRPSFQVVDQNGSLTDDAINALETKGVSPDDFDNMASFELAKLQREGVLTQEQARRYNFFRKMDMEPLTAQVTRSADDFQMQQELAKRSTGVRAALEGQEAKIGGMFDQNIQNAGGVSTGAPISDAVLSKATALDNEIGRLYREARAVIPADRNIQLGKFYDLLRAKAPSNQATNGLISSIRGYLREAGMQGGSATTIGANALPARVSTGTPVNVGQAEALRIELNRLYPNTNREGRAIIRTLKDAIDDDVLTMAGEDFFQQARAAKSAFESGLSRATLSKFDTAEESLVRDILDNSIRPDDVFQNVALSRNWKPSDVQELKTYLTSGGPQQLQQGGAAWSNLRADTIQWIKDQAFKGPVDAAGNQAVSRAGLESAIRRIGRPRLRVILSPQEVEFMDDMIQLAQFREPVRGTALGRGPSAQAIKALEDRLDKYPLIGGLWNAIKTGKQTDAMLNPAAPTIRAVSRPVDVRIPPNARSALIGGSAGYASARRDSR